MGPGGVNFLFLFYSSLIVGKVRFLDVGQGSENVSFDHLHNVVQVGHNQRGHNLLVLQVSLQFVDGVKSLGLSLDVLGLISVVEGLGANLELFDEGFLVVLAY